MGFVTLILIMSASNSYTTSHLLVGLHEEKLKSSEFIFDSGTTLIVDLILTLVAVVIAVVISKSIIKPLMKLKELAEMISGGNLETRIDITSRDEIGDLARSFNQMADVLKTKTVSKDYVDNIINSMIDTLIVGSPEGVILRTNAAADMLLGYSEEELLGLPVTAVIDGNHPHDRPFSNNKFLTDFIGNRETIYLTKDGRKIPVMLSASIMLEDSGRLQGIVCVAQDITGLRHAENELIARTDQQAVIVKLGHFALMNDNLDELMDTAVTLVAGTLGVKFCEILECRPEGDYFLLKAGTGWNKGLVGSARITAGKDSQAGYTLFSPEPVIVHDAGTETRFGKVSIQTEHGIVSGMSAVIGDHVNPYGILGAHTEVKQTFSGNEIKFLQAVSHILAEAIERKRAEERIKDSEERYRALLETASDLIQSVDGNGKFLYVNKKWLDVMGYTMDEVHKMTFMDILTEGHKPQCAEIFRKLCAGERVGQIETEFLTGYGTVIQVEGNINVQYNNGTFVATQGIFRDITERKKTETELTERMHHAALLADVGAALTQSDDLQTVLQSCTDKPPCGLCTHLDAQ